MLRGLPHNCLVGLLALILDSSVLADSMTVTQSVNVTLSPIGKVTVPASITLLTDVPFSVEQYLCVQVIES